MHKVPHTNHRSHWEIKYCLKHPLYNEDGYTHSYFFMYKAIKVALLQQQFFAIKHYQCYAYQITIKMHHGWHHRCLFEDKFYLAQIKCYWYTTGCPWKRCFETMNTINTAKPLFYISRYCLHFILSLRLIKR